MRVARWLTAVALGGLVLAGMFRLRIDTDILALLPGGLPEVRGLRTMQAEFSRSGELVLLLRCGEEDAGLLGGAAEDLAGRLEAAGAAKRARWAPVWNDDGAGIAELLAYLWMNGDPEEMARLEDRLGPGRVGETLEEALDRVATSFEGLDMVMRAHDPFGLLDQEAMAELIGRMEGAGGGFESADGRARLLLIDAPREVDGYRSAAEWLGEVRGVLGDWRADGHEWVEVGLTGDPAFNAEIGGAIERDMSGTVTLTALLIGLLFWWMQRRLRLLAGLGAMVGLVFLVTLGAAGWLFPGGLGVMSAGFAAVLIGLVVDYGVLICQEAKLVGHDAAAVRRAVRRSIVWAALTTAAVFATLNASSLPGIGQLGTLVAVGVGVGAVAMLALYVPVVAKFGAGRASIPIGSGGGWILSKRAAWAGAGAAAAVSGVFVWRGGSPEIEFDFGLMRPRHSQAMETFERVRAAFPGWDDGALKVVVAGDSDAAVARRLAVAERKLVGLKEGGLAEDAWLPGGWWPDAARQAGNREAAARLAAGRVRLLGAADAAGFTEEGTALAAAVFEAFGRFSNARGVVFPESEAAREVMRGFLRRHGDGGGAVLGEIVPVPGALDDPAFRAAQDEGMMFAGWEALRPAVVPLVRRDLMWVFLPMALVMVAMLAVVFRRAGDVALEVLALALGGLLLCGLMAASGWRWNVLNVAAIPLLLGTGVDYGIHMLLALRRAGGDAARVWHGTGKAIVFCGVSTAIGFASLSFASNEAMSSLGRVCAAGILLNMLVAVFLIPGWRGGGRRRR
jgi:predicted RND superfamily exporter protein